MGLAPVGAAAKSAASAKGMTGHTGNVQQSCPKTILDIGMFFDGTLNNRYNTMSKSRSDGSYQNALSNPALLYPLYKNGSLYNERSSCGGIARAFRSIYVEGPGSTRGEEDDSQGFMFGQGRQSGVEARVLSGFKQMVNQIALIGGPPKLEKVVLDVFGFSRGAAAARHFVNSVRARKAVYDPWGVGDYEETLPEGLTVELRFVGIFDTVAAIGTADDDDNDPINVHLKTAQVTKRIYHLTAGDEYRKNFRLNRNTPGGGDSKQLRGAHSDVGGGYRDKGDTANLESPKQKFFYSATEAETARAAVRRADAAPGGNSAQEAVFVSEGFLAPNEPTGGVVRRQTPVVHRQVTVRYGIKTVTRDTYTYTEQLVLDRPWVEVGLSRVALHMMHEATLAAVDGAMLNMPTTDKNYVIPAGLRPYEAAIRAGTLTGAARTSVLRNYGHVSMKGGDMLSGDQLGYAPETNHRRVTYPNKTSEAI